ncbi:MAG: rhomboid family intramembrane serine protease [Opitutaceae bacterium]
MNAVAFIIGLLLPDWRGRMVEWFAFWFPRNEHFAWWQVVTYMFMHGGLAHIFFNMYGLASFGMLLERQWGTRRFLVFYFLCGIGAGIVHTAISWGEFQTIQNRLNDAGLDAPAIESMLHTGRYAEPGDAAIQSSVVDLYRIYASPMLGASGAIYGILVAFGLLHPNAKLAVLFIPVPIAAKYFIPVLIALDLFSGVTGFSLFGGGIAHFAHVGGALIGLLLMWHWRNQARRAAQSGGLRWREG